MNLNVQTIISISSATLAILVFLKDVFNAKNQLKLEKLKLNYKYKLECMSDLVSLYMRKNHSEPDKADELFQSLIVTAQLLCSHKTIAALESLHNIYISHGINSQEFADSYNVCVKLMRKELNTKN